MGSPKETDNAPAPATAQDKKQPTYWELGIITEKPKKPDLAAKSARLSTFAKWPAGHHLKVDDLAHAGFYHAGYSDCARCFNCGGGLKNWDEGDDVLVEHARWFPKCGYIRQLVGQAFIETVQDLNKRELTIPYSRVIEVMGEKAQLYKLDPNVSSLKQDPAVLSLIYLGFDEEKVLEAAQELKEKAGNISSDQLLQRLEAASELSSDCPSPSAGKLNMCAEQYQAGVDDEGNIKLENQQLRQQTVCKICLDQDVAVVFLPCGHLVSCLDCSLTLRKCPICRTAIKGAVRAFISGSSQ